MKHYLLFLGIACFMCININAQSNVNCTPLNRGKEYAPLFMPHANDNIMNVRINLIFIQKDDGTGNFQENDDEQQRLLDDVITILNDKMANLQMPGIDCYTGLESDFIQNTKIRFVDHRYYVRKSSIWNNNLNNSESNLCPGESYWYLVGIDDSINNVLADTLKGINIYFTEDATIFHHFWEMQDTDTSFAWPLSTVKGCSMYPNYANLYASSRIHIPCRFSRYWWMKYVVPQIVTEGNPVWEYEGWLTYAGTLAGDLAHEIGHSFYLYHPNRDYPYHAYPQDDCLASIMNPHGGTSPRNFLPPQEIGLMYFTSMTTNVQQFIPSDTYLGTKMLNTTVSLPKMRIYHSLLIGPSGNVTIPCNIIFSPRGHIEVQNGGILTLENSSLESVQDTWGGIAVQSGGQLFLSEVTINDYNIVVKPGGCLIVNNDLTIEGDHSITIEDGGYLCIDEDASINLVDEFSLITVSPNAILGCPSCNENCLTLRSNLSNSGNGHFITYEGVEYIQDTTIISDCMATGNEVRAGYNVTSTIPIGNVTIENGAELRIKANETVFTRDVEVKAGGSLVVGK